MRRLIISPERALAEGREWRLLRQTLRQSCNKHFQHGNMSTSGIRNVLSTLDRLPFACGTIAPAPEMLAGMDPLIMHSDDSLSEQLRRAGLPVSDAQEIIDELTSVARGGLGRVAEALLPQEEPSPLPKISRPTSPDGVARVAWRDVSFNVTMPKLTFLRKCHEAVRLAGDGDGDGDGDHGADGGEAAPADATFRKQLFALLARYDALAARPNRRGASSTQGGGAGSQAAVPSPVIHAFETWAGAPPASCVECFASPLNHRDLFASRQHQGVPWTQGDIRSLLGAPPWYGSAFADVDAPFGGGRSFFDGDRSAAPSRQLSYQAPNNGGEQLPSSPRHRLLLLNPPFSPQPMARLLPSLHAILAASNEVRTTALVVVPSSFAQLIISSSEEGPHAADAAGDHPEGLTSHRVSNYLDALEASPYLLGSASLAAGEYAFVHGRNHEKTSKKKKAKGESLYAADFDTRLAVLSRHTADGVAVGVAGGASSEVGAAEGLPLGAADPLPIGSVQALLDALTTVWKKTLHERREAFDGKRKERNRKGR